MTRPRIFGRSLHTVPDAFENASCVEAKIDIGQIRFHQFDNLMVANSREGASVLKPIGSVQVRRNRHSPGSGGCKFPASTTPTRQILFEQPLERRHQIGGRQSVYGARDISKLLTVEHERRCTFDTELGAVGIFGAAF
jgi:hypothetical protein